MIWKKCSWNSYLIAHIHANYKTYQILIKLIMKLNWIYIMNIKVHLFHAMHISSKSKYAKCTTWNIKTYILDKIMQITVEVRKSKAIKNTNSHWRTNGWVHKCKKKLTRKVDAQLKNSLMHSSLECPCIQADNIFFIFFVMMQHICTRHFSLKFHSNLF